ncbi:group II intron reverse transcriptase/maturase [Bacillus pacificus]
MSNRLEMERKPKKHKKLRFNEYYDTQQLFDDLYNRSSKGEIFKNLISLIMSEENIKLAYRNIKRNKGSYTKGSNDTTILEIAEQNLTTFVAKVQKALENYNPKPIRRVYIPKRNGDKRPLGIPTMEDRIVQQCIKQILEPICEAKFYNHSYGFRPNRNAKHAIVRAMSLMNISKFHYVVDIDIKGFFDNVNHGKLLKQIWSLGIRDKSLLSIISKILKTEIENVGKMEKGTPQGGIISPLLSNIVLNELDWWISSQWETMITRHNYESIDKRNNTIIRSHKYTALRRTSNLKEMFLVRYADDFKIFCKDFNSAQKTLIAVKKWLKNRLGLEVNNEKSKVTNLRRNYTEFLGFKLKVVKKKAKKTDYVVKSHITEQAKNNITEKYKKGY